MVFYISGIVCVFCNISMVDCVLNKISIGLCFELFNFIVYSVNKWISVGWCCILEMYYVCNISVIFVMLF